MRKEIIIEIGIDAENNSLCLDCDFMKYINTSLDNDKIEYKCTLYGSIKLKYLKGKGYKRCDRCLKISKWYGKDIT